MAPAALLDEVSEFKSRFGVPDLDALPQRYGWPTKNARGYQLTEQLCRTERPLRVIHVGAGASGICLSKFLPESLNNVSLTCYDKNDDIGGTWLENRYPGVACDIPSVNYQFSWARNPNWSHFYSYGGEIQQYLRDIVTRFDLRKYMKLKHEITAAYWNDDTGVWEVHIKDLRNGTTFIDTAEVLINGSGLLNNWKWPNIKGLHDFKRKLCHTADWDISIDVRGKRVAVVGIGSSGIQITSKIAAETSQLYTWVRQPTWVTAGFAQNHAGPNGANFEYSPEQKQNFEEHPLEYLRYCKQIEDELNQRFKFILNGTPEAEGAKEFSTNQMRDKLKGREDLIEKLIPTTFGIGCRRPTPGNGFLEALTLPHVKTFYEDMQQITPKGFKTSDGSEYEVDVIILATGFDTTWVPRFPIVARGKNVQDILAERPISYLAVGIPDIPNYWTGIGPYGPLGHGSFMPICEMINRHLLQLIKKIQTENIKSLAPRLDVCEAFAEHADLFSKRTAWAGHCRSWFKQGKLDGPLSIFPGSRLVYFDVLSTPRYEDYRIEYMSGNPFGFFGNGFHKMEYDGSDLSYYLGDENRPGALLPKAAEAPINGLHGTVNGAKTVTADGEAVAI